jgi:LuxR family transcriptional regulator, quorum-sensing system regulator CinR
LAIVLGKTTLLKSGGLGATMTNILPDEKTLSEAFSIIAATSNTEVVIDKLRDLLKVDHVVYYMPKPSGAAFVRLTYPASWIKRYLQMNYASVDPISREAAQRTLPFSWNELKIQSAAEASFLADALSHGIGPHGFSIPLSEHGHWALFSISFSGSEQEWSHFLAATRSTLVQIANRLHDRFVVEIFGEDKKE